MGRLRLISALASLAALFAVVAPASALAGTYTWSQPGDVSSAAQYGVQSWSYSASSATLSFSSAFTGNGSTLAGYTDSASTPTTWIAAPTSGASPPLEMVPAAQGKSVTLKWTSPLSSSQAVTIAGSVNEPNVTTGLLNCVGTNWTLTAGGTTIASANGVSSTTIQSTPVVAAGGTIVLTVTDASKGSLLHPYSTSCDETDVNLSLSVGAAQVTPSAVTLTAPTAGQTLTSGQPTYMGAAGDGFGYNPQITVRVYSGASASGTPIQTLTTAEASKSWSVAGTAPLANGTYTVQAEQDDLVLDPALSAAVTFTVNIPNNVPPTVTITPLGTTTLTITTPTFTGTAGTTAGDGAVELDLYAGASATGTQIASAHGTVDASGNWSIQVPQALANGVYTIVARQLGANGLVGSSDPVPFVINVSGPPPPPSSTVTLTQPAAGASIQQGTALTFAGAAGTASGDSSTITVTLYKGGAANGTQVGTVKATAGNGIWRATWPGQLDLGLYTAQASQVDGQGQTDLSQAHTFLVVPGTGTVGISVDVSKSRMISIPISCNIAVGNCTGTVLVVTSRKYQPVKGGPTGPIKLLFAYVTVPAGQSFIARGQVSRAVMRALRKKKGAVKVKVTTTLNESGSGVVTTNSTLTLRLH